MKTALGAGLAAIVLATACTVPPEPSGGSTAAVTGDDGSDPRIYLPQHSDWTIDVGAPQTYRVVAYGDSIFAGYQGSFSKVARRAAPWVAGEYLASAWNANVEVVRRALTGGLASEVFALLQHDVDFMTAPATRAVYLEMCGNDYLSARNKLKGMSGRCDVSGLDAALGACTTNMEAAMGLVNATLPAVPTKAFMNLYYPGYDADDVATRCTDPAGSGQPANMQAMLLPYMARSNYRACSTAERNGFACVDAFAELMGADYDSNADGVVDVDGLRFDPSESEDAYVDRITVRLRSTVHDAKRHVLGASTSASYIFSDDVHPTAFGDLIPGTAAHGAPDFAAAQITAGKNPKWDQFGHERIGWALSRLSPATP